MAIHTILHISFDNNDSGFDLLRNIPVSWFRIIAHIVLSTNTLYNVKNQRRDQIHCVFIIDVRLLVQIKTVDKYKKHSYS